MKTKIEIWQKKAKIVLLAENEFEKDLIEKVKDSKYDYTLTADVLTAYSYYTHSDHRIEIDLIEKKRKPNR